MPRTAVWPRDLLWMTLVVVVALVLSMVRPYSYLTWALEIFPVAIALPVLYATARRYPLTPLLYWLIGLHCLVLILGAYYTYARVPLGFWVQDAPTRAPNHYDRGATSCRASGRRSRRARSSSALTLRGGGGSTS